MRKLESAELLLGESGRCLQILRSYPCRSQPQGCELPLFLLSFFCIFTNYEIFRSVVMPGLTGSSIQSTSAARLVVSPASENKYVLCTRKHWHILNLFPVQNRGLGKGHRYNHTPARSTWKKHNTLSLRRYRWSFLLFFFTVLYLHVSYIVLCLWCHTL